MGNNYMESPSVAIHQEVITSKVQKRILVIYLLFFAVASVYIALHLVEGIIPDEGAHFIFSKVYATTWGIPPDSPETYELGWYIAHNPFLYHWINGRIINLVQVISPTASDWDLLIVLRLTSVLYSLGTLFFVICLLKS